MHFRRIALLGSVFVIAGAQPALAAKAPPVELTKCDASLGTIALVDGDQAGWTKYGLGSPRELLNAVAVESGCFTPRNPASSEPVRFLVTAIAGDQAEVDKGIALAKGAAVEGLVRSGAASGLLRSVPFGGSMLGGLGGLGGKKVTLAAGLRAVSPANGMTIASGTGSVTKTSITFGNSGGATGWVSGAASSGYASKKEGQQLAEAFIIAFNNLVAQKDALASAAAPAGSSNLATVAVDTTMRATPALDGAAVRTVRSGSTLNPTGKKEGLFVEVKDNFGTAGWVSVEDLK